jgi:TRAP-type C4-dicarboxylate transport system permease small subunit
LARAERLGRGLETALIVVLLSGLVLFTSAQILLRNVFSIGVTWGDGLVRLTVLWLALLGALAASRDAKHITMGAVIQWLPGRFRVAAELVAAVFAAIVSGAFAYFSLEFVRISREFGDTLLTGVPAWWLQAIMPVVFGLIAYRFVLQAAKRIREL